MSVYILFYDTENDGMNKIWAVYLTKAAAKQDERLMRRDPEGFCSDCTARPYVREFEARA